MTTKTLTNRYGGYITIGLRSSDAGGPVLDTHSTSDLDGGAADVVITYLDDPTGARRNWRDLIRRRISATTGLSASGLRFERGSLGSLAVDWKLDPDWGERTEQYYGTGDFVNPGDCLPGELDWSSYEDAVNRALMNFIAQANSVNRAFQGGVFLGELRETIHQIRHPLSAIQGLLTNYLKTVKKRSRMVRPFQARKRAIRSAAAARSRAKSSLQSVISDTWLEAQFGIKPLVNDVRDAAIALARYQVDGFPSKVVSGKAKVSQFAGDSIFQRAVGTGHVFTRIRRSTSLQVRIYGCIKCTTASDASRALALTGLTWRDFLPTAWELIPYSFLVDYFSNVGSIVEAACFNTASVAWVNIGVYVSSVSEQVEQSFVPFPSPNGHYSRTGSSFTPSGPMKFERFTKTRQPYIGSYMPTLAFKLPGIRQSLNISALLGQSQALSRSLTRRG